MDEFAYKVKDVREGGQKFYKTFGGGDRFKNLSPKRINILISFLHDGISNDNIAQQFSRGNKG